LQQIQDRNARVLVIDLDRTRVQVAVHLIGLIHRMSSRIAVFVKNDVERPDTMMMRARLAKLAGQPNTPHIDPDGWLSCHHWNDVLSAFNSLKERWAGRPPTGEANPPAVPLGSPRGPHSLPPRMVDPALESGLLQHAENWLWEDKSMF